MIGWALRQLLLWGAFAAVAYALVGYRILDRSGATAPPAMTTATRTTLSRAAAPNSLVYHADKRGHVVLDGAVNGATVRFMVDTGATMVGLTMRDAMAAGLTHHDLNFSGRSATANGVTRVAPVTLREVRIGQLVIYDVRAAVYENLNISLLGQSFLTRLNGYEMHEGVLTLTYW